MLYSLLGAPILVTVISTPARRLKVEIVKLKPKKFYFLIIPLKIN